MSSIVASFTAVASPQAAALLEIIHKKKTPTAILRSCIDLFNFNFIAFSFLDLILNTAVMVERVIIWLSVLSPS
jgi:hypothetical protein